MGTRLPKERAQARALRRQGVPLKRIAAKVGVAVSTVHLWTRDIELTAAQHERNRTGPGAPHNPEWIAKRSRAWSERNRRRRISFQQEGRELARVGDPLHVAGCMLYWAEGAKARNVLKICNSDGQMLRFFTVFLREILGVTRDRLRISINAYTNNGLSIEEIEAHWLRLLGLSRASLRKHQVNNYPTSTSGRKPNKLPFGVCTLSVSSSTRELQHIYGAIQEYAGFDEPRWLDGPARNAAAGRRATLDERMR
jgi:hypothetical protein